ncbi:hypothetical protein [Rubinisphaera sp. JC750]|uniref:hypothetical protein n=1 Tax=Rubinisphaera sp. JC750 TaxID=2898658 RepID=UPI001F2C7F55|nr:hypothetical protein [Rubinisphaera sp. JC750]
MGQAKQRPACVLGFYQTWETPSGETSGGILVTSHRGRPIEFQCTLPVRPNPTQQLLYGSTLRPFLRGELIAGALRDKLESKPDILFVNDPDALNAETWGHVPVVSFQPGPTDSLKKQVREHSVWIDPDDAADFDKAIAQFEKYVPDSADLKEPLARVEQALREAMGQAA